MTVAKPWMSKPYKNEITLRADIVIRKGTKMKLLGYGDKGIQMFGYLSEDGKFFVDMKYFNGLERSQKAR